VVDVHEPAPVRASSAAPAGTRAGDVTLPAGRRELVAAGEQGRLPASAEVLSLEWSPRFRGIDIGSFALNSPRPIRGVAARVDLQEPGLSVVTTASNGERAGETDGAKTSTFLREARCQIAVNAAPFSPVHLLEGRPQDISGFHVSDGKTVSPAAGSRPALLVSTEGRASIQHPPFPGSGLQSAVGGFSTVLEDGVVVGKETPLHPRTAAGVSEDGRLLFLLVVDGRQSGYSEGASTADLGRMLRSLGAWDGINLDGGGTTTLVVEGSPGKPEILNRPIHAGVPGFERVSASHLGVRADPL
jgi:hypothetical protein